MKASERLCWLCDEPTPFRIVLESDPSIMLPTCAKDACVRKLRERFEDDRDDRRSTQDKEKA